MIAVTGASGQLGQKVIQSLLAKTDAQNILALVRNPEQLASFEAMGVQARIADYEKPETLKSALQGVEKLLLISSSAVGQRATQHQAVIDAAKAAEVQLLAYTSILKADTSPLMLAQEHKVTEEAIEASGIPSVILRNGWYTENYTQQIQGILEQGAVVGAAEQGIFSTASRQDYADAAVAVLISNENQAGKVYELAGDTGFTLEQFTVEVAKQSEQSITYSHLDESDFAQLLIDAAGLPEGFAKALADSEAQAAKGWLEDESQTLSQLIQRPTTTLAESVKTALVL